MAGVFNSRAWYRYRSEPLAVFGLGLLSAIVFLAVLAPVVTPYPDHAGRFVDFSIPANHRMRSIGSGPTWSGATCSPG